MIQRGVAVERVVVSSPVAEGLLELGRCLVPIRWLTRHGLADDRREARRQVGREGLRRGRRFKDDAKEVRTGFECGMKIEKNFSPFL